MRKRSRRRRIDSSEVVTSLYSSLLGRQPTGGEELTKVEHLERGGQIDQVVGWFLACRECFLSFQHNPAFDELVAPDPLPFDVPRLYVWHIPKTGGSSLREMLRPHFDALEFCGGLTLGELYRMSQYRLRTFRVISGVTTQPPAQAMAGIQGPLSWSMRRTARAGWPCLRAVSR